MRLFKLISLAAVIVAAVLIGWRVIGARGQAGARVAVSVGGEAASDAGPVALKPSNAAPIKSVPPAAVAGSDLTVSDDLRQKLAANGTRSRADFTRLRGLLERAEHELSGPERADVLTDLGAWVARHHLAWGHELAAGLDDFQARYGFVRAVVEAGVRLDPAAAAAWASEVAEPALRASALNNVALNWGETDLAAALAWATALPESASRASAFEGLAWTWTQRDPKAAYEWAVQLTEPEIRDQVFVKMSKILALQEPQQALNWVLQFPEGPARDQALHFAIFQWAAQDLKSATEWSTKLPDKALQAGSDVAIARSWSNQEAQGATVWAAEIADPASRIAALNTTLRKWAEANPAAAAHWIAQQGATPANEEIFRSVTNGLAEIQPAATEIWLGSVTNPAWRAWGEKILAQRLEDVHRKDPAPKG